MPRVMGRRSMQRGRFTPHVAGSGGFSTVVAPLARMPRKLIALKDAAPRAGEAAPARLPWHGQRCQVPTSHPGLVPAGRDHSSSPYLVFTTSSLRFCFASLAILAAWTVSRRRQLDNKRLRLFLQVRHTQPSRRATHPFTSRSARNTRLAANSITVAACRCWTTNSIFCRSLDSLFLLGMGD